MRSRVLLLASVVSLSACPSPPAGGETSESEASETGSSSSGGGSVTEATPTTGEETPTSGGSEETGASCEGCGAEEACVGGSCVEVGRGEVERGCNPLGDPRGRGQCLYPWPSDLTTVADAATVTGRRVNYDAELLPKNGKMQPFAVDDITNDVDGFSPNSQIRFAFMGGVGGDLVPIDDIGRSLDADATIVLVEVESGERVPYFAELDATAQPGAAMTVFVRPARRLGYDRHYAIGVRGLTDGEGAPLEAPPLFRALRDELTTDVPQLEALRAGQEEVFAALTEAGMERASLQLAWGFHTASQERMQSDLVAISPQVAATAGKGDLGYVIDEIEKNPSPGLARVLRGHFTVPSCLAGDSGPGSVMQRDGAGAPDCSGTTEAPFYVGVPQAVWDKGVPVPFVVYGHGLLGTGEEAISIAERAPSVIVAGTDFWGMAQEDVPRILQAFGENFIGGNTVPDRLLQSAVNFTALAYLGQGDFLNEPEMQVEVDGVMTSLIDPSSVQYLGGSQGGIMGGTVVAMAPNLQRGILVVGGANYSLMIWRSTAFAALSDAWKLSHADPQEREFLFALVQSAFDRADPSILAELITNPLGGGDPKRLFLIESIGDCQVPNIASETMARTFDMPLLTPSPLPVWGAPETDEPVQEGSALLLVDTKLGPLPPTSNLPPADDNGAHGAAVDDPAMIEVIERFFFKGFAENLCDGPCDPG